MPTKHSQDIVFSSMTQFPPTYRAPKTVIVSLVITVVLLCLMLGLYVGIVAAVVVFIVFLSGLVISSFLVSGVRILKQIGAIKVNSRIEPRVFGLLENLCLAAGIKIPEVYITDDDTCINALALAMPGKKAALVFTTGVLSSLNRIELEAVVAYQVATLRRKEERTTAKAMKLIAIPTLLWPSTAALLSKLTGPNRVFFVDQTAVLLTKYPPGLYSAIKKAASSQSIPKGLNAHILTLTGPFWFVPLMKSDSLGHVPREIWSPEDRMQVLVEM